jgi:hypothetical protein
MISTQIGTTSDVREKARKALTDYLTMFLPGSWQEPLAKLKLILQLNEEIDWEALKGHALLFFNEMRLSDDRVEALARIERVAEAFKEIRGTSPADWHRTVDDIIQAANFRTSKVAVQTRQIRPLAKENDESPRGLRSKK